MVNRNVININVVNINVFNINVVKRVPFDSADSLCKLLDVFNENVRALYLMEFPTEAWDFLLFNVLLDKLTPSLREKFEAEHCKTEIPLTVSWLHF